MKSSNLIVALTAIAAAATAWLVLSNRGTEQVQDSGALAKQESPSPTVPAPVISPPVLAATKSASREAEPPPPVSASPQSFRWPESTLRFADQPDSDPLLSREMEYQIQRSIGTNIEARKFEVQPIKCRGTSCQILAKPIEPGAGMSAWGPVLGALLKDLTDHPVLNPATGTKVGGAEPRKIMQLNGGGIVSEIGFKKPAVN